MGVRARTINSANPDEWAEILAELDADAVDLLLISPERLANRRFRDAVLDGRRAPRPGWSSSTRPTASATGATTSAPTTGGSAASSTCCPPDVPVLRLHRHRQRPRGRRHRLPARRPTSPSLRGPLARDSLALHVIDLPDPGRSGWRGWPEPSPTSPGTGIVYCLTKRDADAGHRLAAGQRHRRRLLHRRLRRPGGPRAAAARPTTSRWSSPPRRSAWASTSPTSPSSSTSSRPARRSPTTSRSGGPAASSTARIGRPAARQRGPRHPGLVHRAGLPDPRGVRGGHRRARGARRLHQARRARAGR